MKWMDEAPTVTGFYLVKKQGAYLDSGWESVAKVYLRDFRDRQEMVAEILGFSGQQTRLTGLSWFGPIEGK